ncbi:MAG: hypothetical protein E6R07_00035 [Nevskiaceae bacterium]|nr:MAG: hypothetical protein E6R07_00035 [Nevskiaceae bacterium]
MFMELFGLGVLLAGPSGVGKSELALELLTRGHRLIADDAAEFLRAADGSVHGRCPPLLQGFLEARSLGILNVGEMFGARSLCDEHRLDLVIRLEFRHDMLARTPQPLERLEGRRSIGTVLGVDLPEVSIPIRLGHNLAVLVEAACRDLRLRQTGYRADEDFAARQLQAIRDSKA